MVEAWIVSCLLGLGLMAQAWAQANAIASQMHVQYQSIAMELAQDLDERMSSATSFNTEDRYISDIEGQWIKEFGVWAFDELLLQCSSGQGCDEQTLAQLDRQKWLGRVKDKLPQAWVKVAVFDQDTWRITIAWPEQGLHQPYDERLDCPQNLYCWSFNHGPSLE